MRLYNGCPDAELKAVWDSRDRAVAEARKLGYGITYFPVEGKYQGYRLSDYTDSTPFCATPERCLHHIKTTLTEIGSDQAQQK